MHTPHFRDLKQALERMDALVDWERQARFRMKVDLSGIADLLERLGRPHTRFRSVHVTGTKGKGNVCALVEAGLLHAGHEVGRYASPHLQRINERISIRGQEISDEALAVALTLSLDARESAIRDGSPGSNATWFDIMTAAAFVGFAEARLDWAVVEVGLGGRLDSTNVITPDVSVITNIGLEHTEILGNSIEEIAAEKAGIIKTGAIFVTPMAPDSSAGLVAREVARERHVDVMQVDISRNATITDVNRAIARHVLEALGSRGVDSLRNATRIGAQDLPDSVAQAAMLPGRMERFSIPVATGRIVNVVLDGAHVDFALQQVIHELRQTIEFQEAPVVLLALGLDKNAEAMISKLRGIAARIVFTTLHGDRPSWSTGRLVQIADGMGILAESAKCHTTGLQRCLELSPNWLLVTGSLHLVGVLRADLAAMSSGRK